MSVLKPRVTTDSMAKLLPDLDVGGRLADDNPLMKPEEIKDILVVVGAVIRSDKLKFAAGDIVNDQVDLNHFAQMRKTMVKMSRDCSTKKAMSF